MDVAKGIRLNKYAIIAILKKQYPKPYPNPRLEISIDLASQDMPFKYLLILFALLLVLVTSPR